MLFNPSSFFIDVIHLMSQFFAKGSKVLVFKVVKNSNDDIHQYYN